MSEYNDGSSFGYDQVNPYDYIPFTLNKEKKIVPEVKKEVIIQPDTIITQPPKTFTLPDNQTILIFLFIIVIIMQVKMMMHLDIVQSCLLRNPGHTHNQV